MKRRMISIICLVIIILSIFTPFVSAANTSTLPVDVWIRTNGKDIKKTSKIEDLKKMFGNPTLETSSPAGGKMYTFYNESKDYNVYAETNSKGELKVVGIISEDFQSHNYDSLKKGTNGDLDRNYQGESVEDYRNGESVNVGVYVENYTYQEEKTYQEEYLKNQAESLYNLQKHSIYTSKMLAHLDGKTFTQTVVPENIFYMNELLKANKATLYNTLFNNEKYKYVALIGASGYMESDRYSSLISSNPIYIGGVTAKYNPKGEDYKYFIYDIGSTKLENGKYYVGYGWYAINPDFMNERKTVELTAEEKTKLSNVEKMHQEFEANYLKSGNQAYLVQPNVKELPTTKTYGTMNEDYVKAAVAYLNMGRVGIGLNPLRYDKDLSQYAQIKASTVAYLNNYTDTPGSHYFDKPEWMSQTDYQHSMVGAENLYMGGILGGTIFGSIEYALNDGYGDPVSCGHRYNLINPNSTTVGLGFSGGQGCHKFSGYLSKNQELVAWPANGIMPMTLIANGGIGNWTAEFADGKHQFTDNTTVSIKNLNTGTVWDITKSQSNTKFLRKVADSFLAFRDDSVAYEKDDVLEITLKNVKYEDGSIKDYKYRTVFKSFSSTEKKEVTAISTVSDSIKVELGKTQDLKIKLQPENASNKLTYVTSDNANIATVRTDGLVTGKKIGKTTATIKCGNIIKKVSIEVVDKIPVPITSIKLDKTTLNIPVNGANTLKATINPSDTTESKTITWSSSNDKVATVDKNGAVKGIAEGTATITAKAGNKTATCKVTVEYQLPFKDVPKDSWYYNSVKYTYKNGIIAGYNSTTFAPFDDVSRGQLVTMLWRRENKPDTSKLKNNFTDVPEGEYYTEAIKWANSKGIVQGYGGTTKFGPGDPIIRQDLAIVLNKYAKYKGKNATGSASLTRFKDYKTVSDYAENAVKWTVANGIISGNSLPDGSKTIAPHDNATRAEIAVMLEKFFEKFN